MRTKTALKIDRVGGNVLITAIGYEPLSNRPMADISVGFDRDGIRRIVTDLCRTAGLPEPWKKG